MYPGLSETKPRVLAQALKLNRDKNPTEIVDIALGAKTTEEVVRKILLPFSSIMNDQVFLTSGGRVQLGLELARTGLLRDGADSLNWQEFEDFCCECLKEAGFETRMNVRVRGQGRAWQIDIVGFRGDLVLTIDCKHWNTPSYRSRFELAASHASRATTHLMRSLANEEAWENKVPVGLPVILCLMEPRDRLFHETLVVSVEKFPEFLSTVTPHDRSLPFIYRARA